MDNFGTAPATPESTQVGAMPETMGITPLMGSETPPNVINSTPEATGGYDEETTPPPAEIPPANTLTDTATNLNTFGATATSAATTASTIEGATPAFTPETVDIPGAENATLPEVGTPPVNRTEAIAALSDDINKLIDKIEHADIEMKKQQDLIKGYIEEIRLLTGAASAGASLPAYGSVTDIPEGSFLPPGARSAGGGSASGNGVVIPFPGPSNADSAEASTTTTPEPLSAAA
ncbi:hypothetical protein FWH13_01395 [Candidatus Saccharibacteria bacterium]|nr:hypothetical protein [Candidatus Saccharibacteria bacterium]